MSYLYALRSITLPQYGSPTRNIAVFGSDDQPPARVFVSRASLSASSYRVFASAASARAILLGVHGFVARIIPFYGELYEGT
jgi:hypothetical protein